MLVTYLFHASGAKVFLTQYPVSYTPEEALNDAKKSLGMSTRPGAKVVVEEDYACDFPSEILGYAVKSISNSWFPNQMVPQPKWYNVWGDVVVVDRVRLLWEDINEHLGMSYLPLPKMVSTGPNTYPKQEPALKNGYGVFPAHVINKLLRNSVRFSALGKLTSVVLQEDKNEVIFREDFKYKGWVPPVEEDKREELKLPHCYWPGMGTMLYLDTKGEPYCAQCATEVWEKFIRGDMTHRTDEIIAGVDAFDEGETKMCCNCECEIEPSYGVDKKEEESWYDLSCLISW